jgi:hypothetical protein
VLKAKGASFFDVRIKSLDRNESMGYYYAFLKNYKIAIVGYFAVLILWLLQIIVKSDILTYTTFIAALGYIGYYIKSFICYSDFYRSIDKIIKKNNSRIMILSFFCIWGLYKYLKKNMTNELENIKW